MQLEPATRTRERRALVYALCAVGLWSTIATGFKLGLREFTPGQLVLAGACASAVFFMGVRSWQRIRGRSTDQGDEGLNRLTNRERLAAMALGLVNPFVYYFILLEAYDRLPAQVAQPLNYTWAIAMAVLAIPLLNQRLGVSAWAGVALGYVGVVVLITQGDFTSFDRFDPLGVILAVASTVVWALYWLLSTRWLGDRDPAESLSIGFAVALPAIFVTVAATDGLPAFSLQLVGYAIWVGLLEMGFAFLLWQRALQLTTRAGAIAQLIFLAPVVSLVLISTVVGEDIHPSAMVALGAILGGLLLTQRAAG